MSKLLKNFVGIDISKESMDVALVTEGETAQVPHEEFVQSEAGFKNMEKWLSLHGVAFDEQTLFCLEHTGIYSIGLVNYLSRKKALIWIEMAIQIKKSEGLQRSSNDKTDAIKIARYALRFQDRKRLWSPIDERLAKIKYHIAHRDRIVQTISRLTVPVVELKHVGCAQEAAQMEKLQRPLIATLLRTQKNIESEIMKLVKQDQELLRKVKRVTSIKGVGDVTAVACLVYTRGFTCFETAKQFACYCGVVPFVKKQSGTSIRSKARVSPFANMKLKRLLHMCALSAITWDPEIKAYYNRKVAEGKNKMGVQNAVRNKLILRMFAVLRDDRDYVENYQRPCA